MSHDQSTHWRFAESCILTPEYQERVAQWLGRAERRELARIRHPNRRLGGALARVLAKELVREHVGGLAAGAPQIQITSRDAAGRHVPPEVRIAGRRVLCSLSISHTSSAVLVALSTTRGGRVGVDLVRCEPLSGSFLDMWFDHEERELASSDPVNACRIWAVKEAVYKAVNWGEPFVPRKVKVRRAAEQFTCTYRGKDLAHHCQVRTWSCADHVAVLALVTSKPGYVESVAGPGRLCRQAKAYPIQDSRKRCKDA